MGRLGWFLFGALFLCVLTGLAGVLFLRGSAREQPPSFERRIARWARGLATPAEARNRPNPIPNTPEVLMEARAHWADHCAQCHGNDGSGDVAMGKNLYPPAPDMRLAETQQKTDGELFNSIENGIRLTGMPAWGGSGGHEEDSWKLVNFIRHLPQLTTEEKREMERLNPKGPADLKEEEEEEKFLKGETPDVPQTDHQHHHH
jgi:mono/diheme cytochrome c family protein